MIGRPARPSFESGVTLSLYSRGLIWGLLLLFSERLPAAPSSEASSRPALTVVTYNVLYRNTNLTMLVEMIRDFDAGLICLQETTPSIEQRLRPAASVQYPHQFYQTAPGSGGLALLSRWPLKDVRYLPPEKGIRGVLLGRIEPPGFAGPIEFATVHLRTPQVSRLTSLPAILAGFQQAGEIQEREIRRVYAAFQGAGPRLILGDFNSFSFAPAQVFLKAEGWTDSFASVTERPEETPTWRERRMGIDVAFRIDYLFHTSHFRTVTSRVIQRGGSDHYPLLSQLELSSP